MKNKQRTIVIPVRPKNACYFFKQNENELSIRTNFWTFGRVWVSAFFFSMVVAVGVACYRKLGKLEDNPETWDYVVFVLTCLFLIYLFGVTTYILFKRVFVLLNRGGLYYERHVFVHRSQRHIPFVKIRTFKFFAKTIDSKHTEYYVKVIADEELLISCDRGEDADWLAAEMNYMLAFLRAGEKDEIVPQLRENGVINDVKYVFKSKPRKKK